MNQHASYILQHPAPDNLLILLSGCWKIDYSLPELSEFETALTGETRSVSLNSDRLTAWDSILVVFVKELTELCRRHDIEVDLSGLPEGAGKLLALATAVPEKETISAKKKRSFVYRIGAYVLAAIDRGRELARFSGEIAYEFIQLFRGKAYFRPRDFFYFVQACGADALPIVSVISILVGVTLAFVGAVQLQMFGAQIYVANLVALSMVLEMGAMMSGIIIAGRTGAAYAAQLGTMQVNEEIDALKTMGISPICFLVLPRMLALALMLPLLCVYADLLGIVGGAFIGVGMLDLSLTEYLLQTRKAINLNQIGQGIFKSAVFGVLVGYAGCLRGMQCGRSASAVGEATTSAVVTSIVLIVVFDAIMTVIFNLLRTGF